MKTSIFLKRLRLTRGLIISKVDASRTNHKGDEATILALEEAYDSGGNHGDAETLTSFFTLDAIIVNRHGQVVVGITGFSMH